MLCIADCGGHDMLCITDCGGHDYDMMSPQCAMKIPCYYNAMSTRGNLYLVEPTDTYGGCTTFGITTVIIVNVQASIHITMFLGENFAILVALGKLLL